jgi:hypothetical protein
MLPGMSPLGQDLVARPLARLTPYADGRFADHDSGSNPVMPLADNVVGSGDPCVERGTTVPSPRSLVQTYLVI